MAPFILCRARRGGELNGLSARSWPPKNAPAGEGRETIHRYGSLVEPVCHSYFCLPYPFGQAAGKARVAEHAERQKRSFLMAEGSPFPLSAATPRISVVVPARN